MTQAPPSLSSGFAQFKLFERILTARLLQLAARGIESIRSPSRAFNMQQPPLTPASFLSAIVIALVAVLPGCTAGSSPTLPIPPPLAVASSPNASGIVTIRGEGAIAGALVAAYNEELGAGVIGEAEADGSFELQLTAAPGDSITVWQRVGTDTSGLLSLVVPEP